MCKDILCSWIGSFNIVKMLILSKFLYRFSAIYVKIQADFFEEMDELILKFIQKCQGLRLAKAVLNKNKRGGLKLANF